MHEEGKLRKDGIIFINPSLTAEDRYGIKVMVGGQTPPLGLTHVAAMTLESGYRTEIVDATVLGLSNEALIKLVVAGKYKYVGITGSTIAFDSMSSLAADVKKADKEITVIVGGPHVTAVPRESMRRCKDFDICVVGEADYSIVELLTCLETKGDLRKIVGIVFRNNGELVDTGKRPPIKDLDRLPRPAWHLLPDFATWYRPPLHTVKRIPAALLVASRGCPGQCIFCDRSVFGNCLRAYSARATFGLIKELYYNYGIREVQIRDDNYLAFPNRLKELCELIIAEKMDLVWTCAGRVDMVNPEMLALMKRSGCWQIWYGIESGSQKILDFIKKRTTIEQITKAVVMTKKMGINPCGFFIIGSPTESAETIRQTIDFALKLPLDEAHFSYMTPFPGSELYDVASQYGTFDNDWKKLHGWYPMFVTNGLTSEELEHFSKTAFRRFYFRPRIIMSYLVRMKSWQHVKYYFAGLLGLFQIMLRQTASAGKTLSVK
ncbi:MAG TPA: radical SAM protein [Nitrospirota bacterium]|nr:radical SAM protein [Nitrospirota bacterium]